MDQLLFINIKLWSNIIRIVNQLFFISFSDVDSKCTEFEHGTSLHVAASNLSYESAKTLLQYHANPKAKDGLGRTPLGKNYII